MSLGRLHLLQALDPVQEALLLLHALSRHAFPQTQKTGRALTPHPSGQQPLQSLQQRGLSRKQKVELWQARRVPTMGGGGISPT